VSNENENPQVSITTNDGAYIRHQWGIRPKLVETNAIKDSVGWAIKPGIQTNWITMPENDSSWLYFKEHTITGNGTYGGYSHSYSAKASTLYGFIQQLLDKISLVDAYAQYINSRFSELGAVAYWNSVGWGDISNKPSSFTPSSHSHTSSSSFLQYIGATPNVTIDGHTYYLNNYEVSAVTVS
jgi:hypothetical protein